MTLNLITTLIGIAIIVSGMVYLIRTGVKAGKADEQDKALDAIDKANEARRDAAREPDPAERLRDDWHR